MGVCKRDRHAQWKRKPNGVGQGGTYPYLRWVIWWKNTTKFVHNLLYFCLSIDNHIECHRSSDNKPMVVIPPLTSVLLLSTIGFNKLTTISQREHKLPLGIPSSCCDEAACSHNILSPQLLYRYTSLLKKECSKFVYTLESESHSKYRNVGYSKI